MKRAEYIALRRDQELQDIKKVAATAEGRRLISRLFAQTGIFSVVPPENPLIMSFNEGQRNVGLLVMNDLLEVDPGKLAQIRREDKERRDKHRTIEASIEEEDEDGLE